MVKAPGGGGNCAIATGRQRPDKILTTPI